MKEEELKERLKGIIREIIHFSEVSNIITSMYANQILTLIREAGYKSPEEVQKESKESFLAGFNSGLKEKGEP
jgi:hypothetical protein